MTKSRLVPYVDIVVRGTRRRHVSSWNKSESRSPSPAWNNELENSTQSPRKRRKLNTPSEDNDTEDSMESLPQKPPESETIVAEMLSDDEEFEQDEASRRSPSLGAFSKGEFGLDDASRRSPSLGAFSHRDAAGYYETETDEVIEDGSLLSDETPADEFDEDDPDIPVRILEDFTIYDSTTMEIIHLAQLLLLGFSDSKYTTSGLAKAWIDPDSEDDDNVTEDGTYDTENADRLQLSDIEEFCVHNLLEGQKCLDAKLYIRTKYAWYILGRPSAVYLPFFAPFWTRHRLLHLLVNSCLKNYRLTYAEFKDGLQEFDTEDDFGPISSIDILGRNLRVEDDLNSDETMAYIISSLPEICLENRIKISRVPAIRDVMGPEHYDFDLDISHQCSKQDKKSRPRMFTKSSNKEIEVLKHRNKTFLTPTVNEIAKDFFHGSLEAIPNQDDVDETVPIRLPRHKGHYSDPLKIVWGESFPGGKVFKSTIIDGVVYNIGDVVMVEPDTSQEKRDPTIRKASQTVNQFGNKYWFIQIRYFFDKMVQGKKTKMFHGVWFSHGSKTILQETAHSKSLFLLENCDHVHVTAIFKKCHINFLKPGYSGPEPTDDVVSDSNNFFCQYLYDEKNISFIDIPDRVLDVDPEDGYSCFSCDAKEDRENLEKIEHHSDKVVVNGVDYHLHDFVYVQPCNDTRLLEIGQIITLHDSARVSVNLLGRYDEYVEYQKSVNDNSELTSDERRLFLSSDIEDVAPHRLDGVCYVLHLSDSDPGKIKEWIKHHDHYYLNSNGDIKHLHPFPKSKLAYCKACHRKELETLNQVTHLANKNSKLIGMELFSGAGGLGIGMDLSGFVETKYAVEFSPSAAKTYMTNHPNTTVYCQDTNNLLKHAITGLNSEGKRGPLLSNHDQTACPSLPEKGAAVDFIFGGPPCQSFSRMNHSKRRDDMRSSLACNMLSYVEYYEPSYFLLENVAGFLDHKFHTKRQTASGRVEECVVESGMVKFCFRTLIALGYQVSYRLLQAGDYGAPQSRRRVIIWGARRGVQMPQFPAPVFAFPQRAHSISLPTGGKLDPPTRSKGESHFYAPLRPRTVNDAIGDLPPFDWINPHAIIRASARDLAEAQRRILTIPRFDAVSDNSERYGFVNLPGFPKGAKYPKPPQNRYQEWLRQGMEKGERVMHQYTTRFSSRIVEATMNVPLRPLADHRDLPPILLPKRNMRNKKNNNIFYGRMDANGHFKCAVTTLSPATKSQWPVHPTQKRIITVREAARSQGFPDHYIFESINKKPGQIIADQLRQIGNAVAVPFALALGKELGKALVQTWEREEREGSVEA